MILSFNLLILSFSFLVLVTPTNFIGAQLNEQPTPKDTKSLVDLARKCLNVARDEIKRGDLPIALVFVNMADQILAQGNPDNRADNDQNITIKIGPNMCNWDDPESGERYR